MFRVMFLFVILACVALTAEASDKSVSLFLFEKGDGTPEVRLLSVSTSKNAKGVESQNVDVVLAERVGVERTNGVVILSFYNADLLRLTRDASGGAEADKSDSLRFEKLRLSFIVSSAMFFNGRKIKVSELLNLIPKDIQSPKESSGEEIKKCSDEEQLRRDLKWFSEYLDKATSNGNVDVHSFESEGH